MSDNILNEDIDEEFFKNNCNVVLTKVCSECHREFHNKEDYEWIEETGFCKTCHTEERAKE